jgi:hypothetical protein
VKPIADDLWREGRSRGLHTRIVLTLGPCPICKRISQVLLGYLDEFATIEQPGPECARCASANRDDNPTRRQRALFARELLEQAEEPLAPGAPRE